MPKLTMKGVGNKKWGNIVSSNNHKGKKSTRKASSPKNSLITEDVHRMRSSFGRLYGRNPDSFIRSRRRRQGRPSRSPSRHLPTRRMPASVIHGSHKCGQPRKGKMMRECKEDAAGCARHRGTANCKFVHRGEPEWNMLRPEQKMRKGGFVEPLSKVNTYTSWPGGIDPTARLYNQASML